MYIVDVVAEGIHFGRWSPRYEGSTLLVPLQSPAKQTSSEEGGQASGLYILHHCLGALEQMLHVRREGRNSSRLPLSLESERWR